MGDNEAPSALLTKAQRRYLNGEERSSAEERAIRSRIRERLTVAFDDLRLLLNRGDEMDRIDLIKVLSDVDAGRVWPLAAILFKWSVEHPTFLDREDLTEALSKPEDELSQQELFDRVAKSFDGQVQVGVRAALEQYPLDHAPDINNELSISLGKPVSEMDDEELAELPRRTLDRLFQQDDLDDEEYVRAVRVKLGRNPDDDGE